MLFRDAKLKIQQAAGNGDFLVRMIMDTRRYMELESGRLISDEDFYAALAVAMMESRNHVKQAFLDHMNTRAINTIVMKDSDPIATPNAPVIRHNIEGEIHLEPMIPHLAAAEIAQINSLCRFADVFSGVPSLMMGPPPQPPSALEEVYRRHGGAKRPPSALHPLVKQDEIDRKAIENVDVHE